MNEDHNSNQLRSQLETRNSSYDDLAGRPFGRDQFNMESIIENKKMRNNQLNDTDRDKRTHRPLLAQDTIDVVASEKKVRDRREICRKVSYQAMTFLLCTAKLYYISVI